MPKALPTFDVDKEGLRKILAKRGPAFAVWELLQNSWDEDATTVDVLLEKLPAGKARITVEDDDPEGFTDLRHAYTLFAESEKKSDAEKRGRFNLGEKLVIAICDEVSIETTTGTVHFDRGGRTMHKAKRNVGSKFVGIIPMNAAEYEATVAAIAQLIPPAGVETFFNGKALEHRKPIKEFDATLPTEISGEDGAMKRTFRKTTVRLYEPLPDEKASIYEMGIPVVETGDRWHVDVQQKVPLNLDRDNVTPAYLRDVRRVTLDHTHDILDGDTSEQTWVTAALEDPKISEEAVVAAVKQRFGDKVVRYDLHDTEANKIAVSQGYVVLSSRMLPKAANDAIKRFDVVKPAGQVTPSPKPYSPGQGSTRKTLAAKEWTQGMRRIAEFSKTIAFTICEGANITVEIVNDADCMNFSATYGRGPGGTGMLEYNMRTLGRKWFEKEVSDVAVVDLLIHELGHHYSSDHLDRSYLNALTLLAGRAVKAALTNPQLFNSAAYDIPKAAR
jgi:hypothetical protein